MSDIDSKEQAGFLNRWSQRKSQQAVKDKEEQELVGLSEERVTTEQELKTDEDMPPIENLTEESDYSGFMSPKVSEVLRKQALRKLFHMPSLNIVDGLDDYAEDFTNFAPLGDLVTEEMKRVLVREKVKLDEQAKLDAEAEAVESGTEEAEISDADQVNEDESELVETIEEDELPDRSIENKFEQNTDVISDESSEITENILQD